MSLNVFSPVTSNEESIFEELKIKITQDVLSRLFDVLNRWVEQQWYEYLLKDPKIGPILERMNIQTIKLNEKIFFDDLNCLFLFYEVVLNEENFVSLRKKLFEDGIITRYNIIWYTSDSFHFKFYWWKLQIWFKIKK